VVKLGARDRGYTTAHDRERARWVPKVDAGLVDCARCHEHIEPGRPWDLGHNDERTEWTGPEHRVCNRRAGGRNGARVTNAMRSKTVHTSRDW
jgi:hypothetical protein